jgi:hypothetical protein
MNSQHDKPKRWWPRFSLRTLAIVVTLVCCYAACWGPTKTRGVSDVVRHVDPERAKRMSGARVIISPNGTRLRPVSPSWISPTWGTSATFGESATMPLLVGINFNATRHYYFWFFGYVAKLPYERNIYPLWQDVLDYESQRTAKERLGLR